MNKKLIIFILLSALPFSSGMAQTDKGQLQANHMGYYDDGQYTWYLYFNDNEYYARCYLGASTVTPPEWISDVTTITTSVKVDENTTKTYILPTVFVYEDKPENALTYTYTKTVGNITETHDLSYTIQQAGPMATVFNILPDDGVTPSGTVENPLVLTVPDEVTITLGEKGKETGEKIEGVKVTRLGYSQPTENFVWYFGSALTSTIQVPVKMVLGKNVAAIMANTFKDCTNLYGLDFNGNSSLWYIGNNAFSGCANLKLYPISSTDDHAVEMPSSLTQLQDGAFANSGIGSLVVNNVIENLGNNVFENCDNMEYVSFTKLNMQGKGMLLSRDIETFKTTLGQQGITVNTDEVPPAYQRLVQSIPTHVLVYAPNSFNKDYKYLDKGEGGYNIITTGDDTPHCYNFYVYDNTSVTGDLNVKGSYNYWVPVAFNAETCNYNRSFPTGWVTTYLPFDWTLPDGVKAYKAGEPLLTNKDGKTTLNFTEATGTAMKANTPYLLYNGNGSNVSIEQVVTASPGLAIPKSVHPSQMTFLSADAATKATFWGTTEDIANDSAATSYHAYNIREDQHWGRVETTTPSGYVGRFRSFVSNATTGGAGSKASLLEMVISTDDGPTRISTLDANLLLRGDDPIYSVDGRYVGRDYTQLPKGVYVRNGKKFSVSK